MEHWKPIPGLEDIYEVSDRGRVRSLDRIDVRYRQGRAHEIKRRGCILRQAKMLHGHMLVTLGYGHGAKLVHNLRLRAFRGPPKRGHVSRHLNGKHADNRLSNVVWATQRRNMLDKKYHNSQSTYKLTPADVRAIKIALRKPTWGINAQLAKQYDIAASAISKIRHGLLHAES